MLPPGCWQASIPGSEKASLGGPSWMCGCISSPCRLLCTWNSPNRAIALPPFVVTRVCTFCTFVCSFLYHKLDQSAAWAGAWTKFQRSLSKLILPLEAPLGKSWSFLPFRRGFSVQWLKFAHVCSELVGNNWDYSVYCAFLFVRFRDCVELFPTYFSVFPFSRVWLQTVSLRICVIFVSF